MKMAMTVGSAPMRDEKRSGPAPVRLARAIARKIIEQDLAVGTHLGALPDIAQSYGVSVPTLRKAMTYLLNDGFVVSREGRAGGLVVAAPPGQSAMRAMYAFLSGLDLDNAHVGEGRDLIGTAIIERAHRLVDAADQQRMELLFRQAREASTPLTETIRAFDEAILDAAKQPVLALVSRVLGRLDAERHCAPAASDLETQLQLRRETARAILGGKLADALSLHRQLRSMPESPEVDPLPSTRLPNQIGASIRNLIRDQDLVPGTDIGHERALQDRYGVGRSTLRDALRPLETSGVIRIATGRGGGIFVGSAEPYAAAEMTSLYLSSIKLTFQEQIESREILEARAAWLAADQLTPALREALKQAMAADARAAASDVDAWAAKGARVERLIAHACRNPLLEFFTLALVDLSVTQARYRGIPTDRDYAELAARVSGHHGEIVDAILAGLPAKAAFKMRQHIKDLGRWFE